MSQPVPILFLYPSLDVGGAERQVQLLARRLDRGRFRPIIAVQHRLGRIGEELEATGTPVHVLSDARRFDIGFPGRTRGLMRREGVRLVMTHGFSTGVVARLAAPLGGPPVRILAEHTTDERDMSAPKHFVNRCLARWATAWVAVTATQTSYLTDVKHIPASRLHVLPNGIDVERYAGRAARTRVRDELGMPPSAPLAGCIAGLRPEKDLLTLVRAAEDVVRELPEARFVIVGDGPERDALRHEIVARGLERAITLTGFRADIPDVLSAFDVAVLSSRVEALPVAFLEAMASGLPLVGTRVGALVDLIEPEHNGLLVASGDAAALGAALVRVLANPEMARRWGAASRRRAVADYDVDRMVRAYEQLFTELLTAAGVDVPERS